MNETKPKAIIFIDGNNFYHGLRNLGLPPYGLDFERLSRKLTGHREWVETRYYVGRVRQEGDMTRQQQQRRFLHWLERFNRVNYFLGRVESRPVVGTAKKLERWLDTLGRRDDIEKPANVIAELRKIADSAGTQYVEKGVDVMIAADMVAMAYEEKYDVAYLLSADGDFTHAVQKVRDTGRRVFVASPLQGHKIANVANIFIPMRREFFDDCWE